MKYVNVKNASELKLEGVSIAFDKVDDALKAIYFRDAKGNNFRVTYENYNNLYAQVQAPPKKEKRYVLRGDVPVIGKVEKAFEEKYEAEAAERELSSAIRGDAVLTISCEEVEIVEIDAKPATDDAIPF